MKVYKVVTYSSLAIGLLIAGLIISLPFRYPFSDIIWQTVLICFPPILALIVLLFVKPVIPSSAFRNLLGIIAVIAPVATLARWMPYPILIIFLLALAALLLPLHSRPSKA